MEPLAVNRISQFTSLEEIAPAWNALADGIPFLDYEWLATWWRHYGAKGNLYVLVCRDSRNEIVGIAPWYFRRDTGLGRSIRFLGDGEVCTDHLTLLCERGYEQQVARAFARWLAAANENVNRSNRWDTLFLADTEINSASLEFLSDELDSLGNSVSRCSGSNVWEIRLPDSWEDYLRQLSKNHRKQLRKLAREPASGRVVVKELTAADDFSEAWDILIELHQRRRNQLGQPGCFASDEFASFLEDVARRFLARDRLRLFWIEMASQPIAVEIQFLGPTTVHAYQSGLHPSYLQQQPGRLANLIAIRRAIDDGRQGFDLMRGDEPYKEHLHASPRPTVTYRVVSRHLAARLRGSLWEAGGAIKDCVKRGLVASRLRGG